MRPLPRRLPSKAAKWALRLAVFVPVLAILSLVMHRTENVDTPTFLVLLVMVALLAAVALLFIFLAFRSLWVHGLRGGRRATWALVFVVLIAFPYVYAFALSAIHPNQADVSTDLVRPPVFADETKQMGNSAVAVIAGELRDGYPEITGRRYTATVDTIIDEVLMMAEERRWTLTTRRGRVGADNAILLEYARKSPVLAMPTAIIVRVADEGDTTYLDIRSKSLFVTHDLGTNADLITQFLTELDFELAGSVIN